jgi:PAT family beta-lactamase induction signal transducer AmpG
MAVLFLLGLSGGLPLLLTGQLLRAWLQSADATLEQIATFSLVGLAYTFKFAWAPLFDRFRLPFLGRRRGFILLFQILLGIAIALMGTFDPILEPELLAAGAVVVAFLSASQDVVIDAYKADLLTPEERAAGIAMYVIGYRIAMAITGILALSVIGYVPWPVIYGVIAGLVLLCIFGTLLAEEPPEPAKPLTLVEALYRPFVLLHERLGTSGLALAIAFVVFYKFGDHFVQVLLISFLKDESGAAFRWIEIATVYKLLGTTGMAIGGLGAGILMPKLGIRRVLIIFGILQAFTNLLYILLAYSPGNLFVLGSAVLIDYVAGAMGTAAFISYMMSICSPSVSATQFALLTSLSSVGERVFGPFAANVVESYGWEGYFIATTLMAVPGLVLAAVVARNGDPKLARPAPDP